MVSRGPEACSVSATTLSAGGAAVACRVSSRKYRLRWQARISFSTEALAVIGLVAMVPVIIASQGSIGLIRTYSHKWGPFEVGEVPNDGQEPVIGDVESSELGGSFLFSDCPSGCFCLCLGCFSVRIGP